MNAPSEAAPLNLLDHVGAADAFEPLPLSTLAISQTDVQQRRRARFNKEALAELIESVRLKGVRTPILCRPHPNPTAHVRFEIVAGERRYLAAKAVGLGTILAVVRSLTDAEVVSDQLIENLQRETLHELEEAQGYAELMQLQGLKPEQLAELFHKSRSYVYNRLKLRDLCPEAVKAVNEGKLDVSIALLIARIGHHDTQRAALKDIFGQHFGETTYRRVREHVQQHYMLDLGRAPFDIQDANLVGRAGTCGGCPKRTGNQVDLFTDVKNPNVCTDPKCYGQKKDAHLARQRAEAEAKGRKVITGEDAKRILPWPEETACAFGTGYVSLDQPCPDDPERRTVRAILGDDWPGLVMVEHPLGTLVGCLTTSQIAEGLKAKGIKTVREEANEKRVARHAVGAAADDTDTKPDPRQSESDLEMEVRRRTFHALRAKLKGRIERADLALVARVFYEALANYGPAAEYIEGWFSEDLYHWRGQPAHEIAKLDASQLGRVLVELALTEVVMAEDTDAGDLYATAKRHHVDPARIRKDLQAQAKQKAKAEAKAIQALHPKKKTKAAPAKGARKGKR